MLLDRDCIPCILNQICRVLDRLGTKEDRAERILRLALRRAAGIRFRGITAPEFSQKLYQVVARETGRSDPYRRLKKEQNDELMRRIGFFRSRIEAAADPLRAAAVFALLGNVIDYGGRHVSSPLEVFAEPGDVRLGKDRYGRFRTRLRRAQRLLYIADNAGEAVLDRLFIEEMVRSNPGLAVTYAVRSQPAINDILAAEARAIGIGRVASIISSGSILAGTLLARTTTRFRRIFHDAHLVVSKGQGNFETLEEERREIFFLFKIKCQAVSRHIGMPEGTLVFADRDALRGRSRSEEGR